MENAKECSSLREDFGLVIFVLSLATLMSSIDTNIVNIGLPTIGKALNAGFSTLQWIALSYMLAVTSLIVGIGRIGDIFGKKKIFIFGIILFTIASFLCGIAGSIYSLIGFRALQGIGGAVLMALSFAIAGDLVEKSRLMQGIAILTIMMPIGFALGPSVGGFLISIFGWRAVFFFNVPIGILAFVFVRKFPEIPVTEKIRKFDVPGMLALTVTLICYVLSVTLAEDQGISRNVIVLWILTALGVAVFILMERNSRYPLIRLSMFKNIIFSSSLVMTILTYTVMTGNVIILPFYLQQAKGLSTSFSGLLMMAGPLGCALFTPLSSKAAEKFGNFSVMIFGMMILGIGALLMSTLNISTHAAKFTGILFLFNGSLAFFQTPNNAAIISSAKPEQRGLASGILNLARTIGQTTGASVIGAVFYCFMKTKSIKAANPVNIASAIHHTYFVAAAILALGLVIGILTSRAEKLNA